MIFSFILLQSQKQNQLFPFLLQIGSFTQSDFAQIFLQGREFGNDQYQIFIAV